MKQEFWEVVRENLIWYRQLEIVDHGDLVIAEEAICEAHKKIVKGLIEELKELKDEIRPMTEGEKEIAKGLDEFFNKEDAKT